MSKELPIIMSALMVRAILEDRKTVTRRIINPQPIIDEDSGSIFDGKYRAQYYIHNWKDRFIDDWSKWMPEDLLWVRETGWVHNNFIRGLNEPHLFWKADYENYSEWERVFIRDHTCPFKSIHMYKEFARIWLQVESIRVERLNDISPGDAVDEGINYWNIDADALKGGELSADFENYMWRDDEKYEDYHFPTYASCIDSYRSLWLKFHGEGSWELNPFVWRIEFKKVSHDHS